MVALFRCEPLSAWIGRAQCAENQQLAKKAQRLEPGDPERIDAFRVLHACPDCRGLGGPKEIDMSDTVKKHREEKLRNDPLGVLSPQQRKIWEAHTSRNPPLSSAEVAQRVGIKKTVVQTQLSQCRMRLGLPSPAQAPDAGAPPKKQKTRGPLAPLNLQPIIEDLRTRIGRKGVEIEGMEMEITRMQERWQEAIAERDGFEEALGVLEKLSTEGAQ